MKKILLTGFKPFGAESLNPSEILVKSLERELPGIDSLILPVEFGHSFSLLREHLKTHQYDWIIQIGQAAGREHICLERIALNWIQTDQADEAGFKPQSRFIDEGGALALMTSFPLDEVHTELKEKNFPVKISLSAGSFVCNELYYRSLAEFKNSQVLFIHVPLIDEQVSAEKPRPYVRLPEQMECLKSLLQSRV